MKYTTIMADPPWPYNSPRALVGNGGRGSDGGKAARILQVDVTEHYATMSMDEIKRIPVEHNVADDAHLYLWTTNSFMVEAHEVARSWGFEPKTIITWIKHKQEEPTVPSMKIGYWFRSASEHCIFAVRGKLRLKDKVCIPTWFAHPRLPHSTKPDAFRAMIERASPGPYLEMFARAARDGWDVWGDQAPGSITLVS
jgi:N6-adenosine-specific RNA methylase IME4